MFLGSMLRHPYHFPCYNLQNPFTRDSYVAGLPFILFYIHIYICIFIWLLSRVGQDIGLYACFLGSILRDPYHIPAFNLSSNPFMYIFVYIYMYISIHKQPKQQTLLSWTVSSVHQLHELNRHGGMRGGMRHWLHSFSLAPHLFLVPRAV